MKQIFLLVLLTLSANLCFAQSDEYRQKKWTGDIGLSASVSPSIALNDERQQLAISAGFGRNLSTFFYLGAGGEYIKYIHRADALPIYINPRIYFSSKMETFFVDTKLGLNVISPENTVDGETLHACTGSSGIFADLSFGYSFGHVAASVGFDIYPIINETFKLSHQGDSGAEPAGGLYLKLSYLF